jgi:putative membrane protein
MELKPSDLIKVGLTENHLRSGGLIFLFFFWIYSNLQEVGVDVDDYSQEIPEWELGFGIMAFFVALFLILSVVISMVRMVVKYFDLKFLRSNKGFKIESGLFTRREVSAMDHKIQHISWSDNLLRKLVGYKNLSLNQASSVEMTTKQNIKIPGCNMDHIRQVVTTLFGNVDLESIEMNGIDKRYFLRFAVIVFLILTLACGLSYYFESFDKIKYIIPIGLYLVLNRYIAYRKMKFGHDGEILFIKGGIFGDKAEILPMYKIQALELHQTPYQSRNMLCSLTLYTASGRMRIPYINQDFGRNLTDVFLKKVEIDRRRWM